MSPQGNKNTVAATLSANGRHILQYADAEPRWVAVLANQSLMQPDLKKLLDSKLNLTHLDFTYGDHLLGSNRLFGALSNLFNTRFNPVVPVKPDQLVTASGASVIIDELAALVCDPGDAVLIACPYYNGFDRDLIVRAKAIPVGVNVGHDLTLPSTLDAFERELLRLKAAGTTTRAVILANPHNPIGFNYPRETVLAYCRFCEKYDLHLFSDEIYALSQFDNPNAQGAPEFTSLLSVDVAKEAGCDPSRVHVIYGISKDFGSNGLRVGALVTQHNPELRHAFTAMGILSKVSSPADSLWSALLNDEQELDWFVSENHRRLADTFKYCATFFRKHNIPFIEPSAAHFLWIDLRGLLRNKDGQGKDLHGQAQIEDLWDAFLTERLYIRPGFMYHGTELGWFRFTFTVRREVLDIGLARFAKLIEKRGRKSQ